MSEYCVGVLDGVLTLAAADMSGSNRWRPLTSGSCCWTSMMTADHRWCLSNMWRDLSSACSTPLAIQISRSHFGDWSSCVLCKKISPTPKTFFATRPSPLPLLLATPPVSSNGLFTCNEISPDI